jgi:hypothetical protein
MTPKRKWWVLHFRTCKRALRGNTVARVTISPHDRGFLDDLWARQDIENLVAIGIGPYFLSDPKPSSYHGKKGTWGMEAIIKINTRSPR